MNPNFDANALKKREEFAVSLRKKKAEKFVREKRMKISQSILKFEMLNQYENEVYNGYP